MAVTLRWRPSADSSAISGAALSPRVLVTGIFTQTLVPHDAMRRAWSPHLVEVVGEHLEGDRPVGDVVEDLAGEPRVVAPRPPSASAWDWW